MTPPPTPPSTPVLGHAPAFARDPLGFVRRAVETTGDAFRMRLLGRDVYVLAHPEHVERTLTDRETFAKPDEFEVAFGDSLLAAEGEQWRRQRRAVEGFFGADRVREHAGTMAAVADARVDRWTSGSAVRLDDEMRAVALRNLFQVVLGGSLADGEVDDVAEAAGALNRWFEPTSWVLPRWVPTPARREFRRGSETLRRRARAFLDGTDDESPDDESLLDSLRALCDDSDSAFTRSEVLDQVVGMLFAGHETTALAMTYALHQIGSHPAVAERVRTELDDAVDGVPTAAALPELEYLGRVIDEALRLYPPVHAVPRVAARRADVGEYVLPADAQVLVSVWSVHRDSRFYEDPLSFDPDRWAGASSRDRGYAFVPFGAGPRVCIGRHFARAEAKAVLAAVLRRCRLEPEGDVEVAPQMTSQPRDGVTVRLRARE